MSGLILYDVLITYVGYMTIHNISQLQSYIAPPKSPMLPGQ